MVGSFNGCTGKTNLQTPKEKVGSEIAVSTWRWKSEGCKFIINGKHLTWNARSEIKQ